ncbi:MAG TPA: GlsB/YeaQ/YmgE family stress response membrane protein [Blastocatellia bacterium]|nr:GlsB/YeaQ/YmgE family stress response membrane protein [Blastocatellia bacterium]
MTVTAILILLLIAGICGAIGQAISGFNLGGILVTIAVGFIGALLGGWLAHVMGLPELFRLNVEGQQFPIVWSIIGSALFVALIGTLRRGRPAFRYR